MSRTFQSVAEQMHWISSVPLGITIGTIGLVGNSLSVVIWYRILKKKVDSHSSTRLPDGDSQILRLCAFGPAGFWTMAQLR